MSKQSIIIPFQGFYNSWYSDAIDREQEQFCEYEVSENRVRADITESELNDLLWYCADYSAAYLEIAKKYVDAFQDYINEETGENIRLEFETMTSPKYYNFTTDRIFCFIHPDDLARMFEEVKASPEFKDTIEARHKSRSGFISYYAHDLETWLLKDISEYDHNEAQTVLIAWLSFKGIEEDSLAFGVYELMADGETFFSAFDSAVDWKKYESKLADLIAEKDAENLELNPDYVAPYRCDETLSLPL